VFAIETMQLTKYYSNGKVKALEDLSLQVNTGQIFSLLGPNGAGKTTLIKLLLGICHPTRGHATLLGAGIGNYQSHAKLGYLAENQRFPDFLNAHQVLYYFGKMNALSKSLLQERIPQLLRLVKLEGWEKVKSRKYSKGMLQRLGIAQALINNPQLLFLDEPTDGIDPVGRREVRDILIDLRNQGKTIFLNSHLLSEVERVSDEIAILKKGKLIRKGDLQEFISVKDTYQLKLSNGDDRILTICEKSGIGIRQQTDGYLVSVNDVAHLNKLIDDLREQQIIIRALIPYKISLEDFFIEILEEKKGD
jgi:ABC-2 type transport system ATP-binding protein